MIEMLKKLQPEVILKSQIGLEREGLRVTADGKLALTKHPEAFGDKLSNPHITTDFSESQIELITPVFYSCEEACDFLDSLTDQVLCEIAKQHEWLWPQSMPCIIEDEETIPIAVYDGPEGKRAHEYRKKLKQKYGGKRQLISGMHFNFSFGEEMLEFLWSHSAEEQISFKEFKNNVYLKTVRNYLRYRWLVIYLFGSSPAVHDTYLNDQMKTFKSFGGDGLSLEYGMSARNGSQTGYKNRIDLYPDYSNLENYIASVRKFIKNGEISEAKELYSQIRLKSQNPSNPLNSLEKGGIKYVEIRTIDLNVFEKRGISKTDCEFMDSFMLFLMLEGEEFYSTWQQEALLNEVMVAENGLDPQLELLDHRQWTSRRVWAEDILSKMIEIDAYLDLGRRSTIDEMIERIQNPDKTYAYRLKKVIKNGYIDSHLRYAQRFTREAIENSADLKGLSERRT